MLYNQLFVTLWQVIHFISVHFLLGYYLATPLLLTQCRPQPWPAAAHTCLSRSPCRPWWSCLAPAAGSPVWSWSGAAISTWALVWTPSIWDTPYKMFYSFLDHCYCQVIFTTQKSQGDSSLETLGAAPPPWLSPKQAYCDQTDHPGTAWPSWACGP